MSITYQGYIINQFIYSTDFYAKVVDSKHSEAATIYGDTLKDIKAKIRQHRKRYGW